MTRELAYSKTVDHDHLKSFGQYFTPREIARFMCSWACRDSADMLDPAAGNSVFLSCTREINPRCRLTGYELDKTILDFFGNPASADLICADYLLTDWDNKYDAIVCNPPYNRFQSVSNRSGILDTIYEHTGIRYSSYTNLYSLFLIKSICQLSANGKLAYIVPTEFLNSEYGTPVKELLLREKLLTAIVHFPHNDDLFFNATTTCCILLLDRTSKDHILFYNIASAKELTALQVGSVTSHTLAVKYTQMTAAKKWRSYLHQEKEPAYANLTDVSRFCTISRGIATGANRFFCLSGSMIARHNIPENALTECVCHSADVSTPFFTREAFSKLAAADKTVYLLDIQGEPDEALATYLQKGETEKVDQKHLPSHRHPWYSMEQQNTAPIWVSSACRNQIKFIRNLAGVKTLTTFHTIYVKEDYAALTDVLFCYFLTPIAQDILCSNRKELGNGLTKFQPGDLQSARMLDLTLLSDRDLRSVISVYQRLLQQYDPTLIDRLNTLFTDYLSAKISTS